MKFKGMDRLQVEHEIAMRFKAFADKINELTDAYAEIVEIFRESKEERLEDLFRIGKKISELADVTISFLEEEKKEVVARELEKG